MSFLADLEGWLTRIEDRIKKLEERFSSQQPSQSPATTSQPAPQAPTQAQATPHANVTELTMMPDAEAAKFRDAQVAAAGSGGDSGWQPGFTLDAFGVGRANVYQSNKTETYTIIVPAQNFSGGGFEFVWSEAAGSVGATVSATVSGPAGSFSSTANQRLGSVPVRGAKIGETYIALVTYSVGQLAHAQINPLS